MVLNGASPSETDVELVRLTLEDKENYRYLTERYETKLRRYIMRLSGLGPSDADDILQEVFIKTYKNLNGFDSFLKFSSWIYRIAHNETISYLRKANSRPKIIGSEDSPEIVESLRADLSIEGDIDKKYLRENLSKMIDRLVEKYRAVLILKYMEDKDYQEISDILKKPAGTVSVLLKRAREKLAGELVKNKMYISA